MSWNSSSEVNTRSVPAQCSMEWATCCWSCSLEDREVWSAGWPGATPSALSSPVAETTRSRLELTLQVRAERGEKRRVRKNVEAMG